MTYTKKGNANIEASHRAVPEWNPDESKFTKTEGIMGTVSLSSYAAQNNEDVKVKESQSGAFCMEDLDSIFEKFVEEYSDRIFNLMYWKVGHYEDARDLTSEVLFKVYKNLPKFRGQSSLYTWAYRIALNHANRFLLRRKIRRFISFDELKSEPVEESNEYESVERNELRKIVRKAIQELPNKYKDIVILRYLENRSYEDISDILELPIGTVKSRLNRAREKLANKLRGVVQI